MYDPYRGGIKSFNKYLKIIKSIVMCSLVTSTILLILISFLYLNGLLTPINILIGVDSLIIYFLPTIRYNGYTNGVEIFFFNLILGWTIFAWVILIIETNYNHKNDI